MNDKLFKLLDILTWIMILLCIGVFIHYHFFPEDKIDYSLDNCSFQTDMNNKKIMVCLSKIETNSLLYKTHGFYTKQGNMGVIVLDDVSVNTILHETLHHCQEFYTGHDVNFCMGELGEKMLKSYPQ